MLSTTEFPPLLSASQAINQAQPRPKHINTGSANNDQSPTTTTDQSSAAAHVTPSQAHHQALTQSTPHSIHTLTSLSSIGCSLLIEEGEVSVDIEGEGDWMKAC